MNFTDILLRLLPFSGADDKGQVTWVWNGGPGDWIITVFIVLLLGVFVRNGWRLLKSKGDDEKMIARLKRALEEYKGKMPQAYNDFTAKLGGDRTKKLADLWAEFDQSLIKTENQLTGQQDIRKSIDAEYFFNKHTLLTHLGSKYYASVPSILLGIGLIGTFTGLFYGLVQLDMGNADTLKESMRHLINAAGVKFAASIWGLGLSLLFTIYEKRAEGKLENEIKKIQLMVNMAFTRKTAEQSLSKIEEQAVEQTKELRNLSITLTDESIGKLSDALGQKIQDTLQTAIAEPIQKLSRNIGGTAEHTLYDSMKSFSGGLGDEFVNGMRGMMTEMLKQIREATGTDAEQLKQTLAGLVQTLSGLQKTFEEQNSKTQRATDDTLKKLSDGLGQISVSIDAQNTALQTSIGKILATVEKQVETYGKNTQDLGVTTTKVTMQINNTVQDVLAKISQQLEQFTTGISETFAGLHATIEQSKTQLAPVPEYLRQFASSTENLKSSAENANGGAQKISESVGGLSAVNTGLNTAVTAFASALVANQAHISGVSDGLSKIVTKADEISQSTANTYTNLANSYGELLGKNAQSIAGFTDQVQAYKTAADESIAQYQNQTNENIKNTLGQFDAQLQGFATSLSSAIGELNEAVERLSDLLNRKSS